MKHICHSLEETESIATQFAASIKGGKTIAFKGDLGAGKTTFIKAFAHAFSVPKEHINSPTFQYLNIYPGTKNIYHFDLYRLKSVDDFFEMGFEEYLSENHITCIEWSERIESILPPNSATVSIEHLDETSRIIEIEE